MKLSMKLKIYKKVIIFIFSMSSLFSVEYSDYTFDFFSISGDPRSHAIGGNPNPESMALNSIYTLNKFHNKGKTSLSYAQYYSGIIESFQLSYIIKNNNKSGLGVSLIQKKIEVHNTEHAYEYNGTIISPDQINYNNIDYYDNQQIGLVILYSINNEIGNFGFKIKPIYTSHLNNKAFGASIDIGFNKKINTRYLLGISINNLISINKWDTGLLQSNFPHLYFSNSIFHEKINFYSELILSSDLNSINYFYDYRLGAEYFINSNLKVLSGYSKNKSFSVGLGFNHRGVNYSYSFNPNFQDILLGQDHQFGILLDLPKKKYELN